jgi:surface antigen
VELQTTSNVPYKMPPNGSRGNVTTIERYRDGANHLDEHFRYDDTGVQGTLGGHPKPAMCGHFKTGHRKLA